VVEKPAAAAPPAARSSRDGGTATAARQTPATAASPAEPGKHAPSGPTGDAGAPIVVEAEAASPSATPAGPSPSDLFAGPRRKRARASAPPPPPLPIPGGPLAIPGTKVDLETARVERFTDDAGTGMAGRLVDVDSGRPVAGAQIEAWMGTRSIHTQSDADGSFRFEGLVPRSKITLWITGASFVQERTEVAVPGQPQFEASFPLLPRSAGTGSREAGVGLFLTRRGSRTVVTGLTAFGPAERAGIQTGDAVVAVGKRDVTSLGPGAIEFLVRGPMGSEVTLTVQPARGAPRSFTLKRSGR
jgi:hypothetical protein